MKLPSCCVFLACFSFAFGAVAAEPSTIGMTVVGKWVKLDIASSGDGSAYPKRLIMVPLKSISSIKVLERGGSSTEPSTKEEKGAANTTLVISVSSSDVRRDTVDSDVLVEHLSADHAREIAEKLLKSVLESTEVPAEKR